MDTYNKKRKAPNFTKPREAPKAKGKVKKPKVLPLTKANLDKLAEHSDHHSKKHMALMRKLMKEGKTFSAAHKEAIRKVGK